MSLPLHPSKTGQQRPSTDHCIRPNGVGTAKSMKLRQVPDLPADNNRLYHNRLNRSLTVESETAD